MDQHLVVIGHQGPGQTPTLIFDHALSKPVQEFLLVAGSLEYVSAFQAVHYQIAAPAQIM